MPTRASGYRCACAQRTPRTLIQEQICAAGGAIAFSRFMELALYAPGLGYYSAGARKFGAAGDFVTAPELGGLFAHCVAASIAPVLQQLGPVAEVLEVGAGSGAFAEAALQKLQSLEALPARYAILEPSADLRDGNDSTCNNACLRSCGSGCTGWTDPRSQPGMGCCSPTR